MNLNFKMCCSLSMFSIILISKSVCQPVQKIDSLKLNDLGRVIENSVRFNTSNSNYEKIQDITGQKITVTATMLIINGDTLDPLQISTRGQTSLNFRRKSFAFDLKSKATFHHGNRTESFKKFYLTSLSMDRNYCSNRLAFEMMEDLKLFPLFYTFCELQINGVSEGTYMLVERPEDWAMKEDKSPLIIRRGLDHSIDKIKTGSITRDEAKKNRDSFNLIYKSLDEYEGEQLYKVLSDLLDMDSYLKWIGFNFFVKNGDYTDEVFFYVDKDKHKYNIIPWDYDDLFSASPHEGDLNKKLRQDKLFYSTEDNLDRKIVTDPVLYNQYLIQLRQVLSQLTPDTLKSVFENTYAELYPFYSNSEIISKSAYDLHPRATLSKLKNELSTLYIKLLIYRDVYIKDIDSKIK
jgi:spore coat protein H